MAPVTFAPAPSEAVASRDLAMSIWRCPRCRGCLKEGPRHTVCEDCRARFERVGPILDLRVPGASWIDCDRDRAEARRLLDMSSYASAADLVRHVFSSRSDWTAERVENRARQVLEAPRRLRADVKGWLRDCMGNGLFLDLGCGPGMLLAAAAAEGYRGVGVDVSLVWLVVAKKLIEERGGEALLAAGMAEALPLADRSLAGVVSLDVIEHVADPVPYLREIDRVTAPGGRVALSTPNRYSLAPEPHVNVMGVGWLPRHLQSRYVEWRTGSPYEFTRLLSARETAGMVRAHTKLRPSIVAPPIPDEEVARFSPVKARIARGYNALTRRSVMQPIFRCVGPFFRVLAQKAA
jgi:SAM-dependent methyltransferase